jgi:hypothetical protein
MNLVSRIYVVVVVKEHFARLGVEAQPVNPSTVPHWHPTIVLTGFQK